MALIGIPANGGTWRITQGLVDAVGVSPHLTSLHGVRETLSDAIVVLAHNVVPGESGGAAIDASGKVIGVIEGSNGTSVVLTPAADVMALQ